MLFFAPGIFYQPVSTIPQPGSAAVIAAASSPAAFLPNADRQRRENMRAVEAALVPVIIPVYAAGAPQSATPSFIPTNPAVAAARTIRAWYFSDPDVVQKSPPRVPTFQPFIPTSPWQRDAMLVALAWQPLPVRVPRPYNVAPLIPPPPPTPRPTQQGPLMIGPAIGL